MKKSLATLLVVALMGGLLFSSCYITKTPVGAYRAQSGIPTRYSKGKQVWLFGIFPLGRTNISTPPTDFMIEGKQTFGDYLVSFFTLGIVETRTLKCYVKEYNNGYGDGIHINNNNQNASTQSRSNTQQVNSNNNAGYDDDDDYSGNYQPQQTNQQPRVSTQQEPQRAANPQSHPLVGKRVMWTTPQGNTRYGTVTSIRNEDTCVVKTEDTGSSVVIRIEKLTKLN